MKSYKKESKNLTKQYCHCEEPIATWQSYKIASHSFAMTEYGRSMVEMLGVLAIIGILSVAGIAGYSSAMNRHKANTIINEAQKRATLAVAQIQMTGKPPTLDEFTNNNLGYGSFSTTVYTKTNGGLPEGQFGIKLENVSKEVCQNILNSIGDNSVIRWLSTTDAPTSALTTCGETNTFLMVYNNDMTTNLVAGEYTFDTCPESFYKCTSTTSCVASKNDCPSICALDEDLSSGCVCPEHRDKTGNKCGDCVDEETYQPWTQPVLTSNGTMGSSDFACDQSSFHRERMCWEAFDKKINTSIYDNDYDENGEEKNRHYWHSGPWEGWPQWISWYTKNLTKINSFTIMNIFSQADLIAIKNFQLQYLDSNSNWIEVNTFTNTNNNSSATSSYEVSNSLDYHQYWRLYITSGYSSSHGAIGEITIDADELVTTDYELNSSGKCVKVNE